MFSCVGVDCGYPSIPEGGILQVVQTHKGNTLYEDQIQFKCRSKYYTLDGPGNSLLRWRLVPKSPPEIWFYSHDVLHPSRHVLLQCRWRMDVT